MTVPVRRRFDAPAVFFCATLIVAASFAAYARQFSPDARWAADANDPADYRFIAEYFWDIPFHSDTYDPIWHAGWGDYLRTIPFRGLGLGSLYLLVGCLRL